MKIYYCSVAAILSLGAPATPASTLSATDACQLYAITDPPISVFYCDGLCDNQAVCSQVTVTVNGNSGATCRCGPKESSADCLGAVFNKAGTITWECEANGGTTGCTNPGNQQGAVCSCR